VEGLPDSMNLLARVPVVRSFALPTGSFRVPARAEQRCSAESLVLSLVVPAYNETVNIEPFLQCIRNALNPGDRAISSCRPSYCERIFHHD
jgi:hypothetical protein